MELQDSIPWRDGTQTRRHGSDNATSYSVKVEPGGGTTYKASWCYSENVTSPNWCAEMTLRHESLESLLDADATDPWDYFTPQTCLMYSIPLSPDPFPRTLIFNIGLK